MNTDLDGALARLAGGAAHPGLGAIDDEAFSGAVFARIDAARAGDVPSLRVGALAALGAVTIGLASTGLAPAPAQAAAPLLDASTALAPSTLLSGLLR